MKFKTLCRTGLMLSSAFIMLLHAQDLRKKDSYWIQKYDKVFQVKTGGTLKLTEIRGDVTIKPGISKEVRIQVMHKLEVETEDEAKAIVNQYKTNIHQEGNSVLIDEDNYQKRSVTSRYNISIPKQYHCDIGVKGGDVEISGIMGKITARIGGGDISIMQILGPLTLNVGGGDAEIQGCEKEAVIQIGGGDIELQDMQSSLDLQIGGGDVELSRCTGPLTVNLGGGDMEISHIEQGATIDIGGGDVEMNELSGGLQCTIGGGSIEMTNVSGEVDVKSAAGDIEAEWTRSLPADSDVSLVSSMGDIDLTLSPAIKATLYIEVEKLFSFSDDMPEFESDFPLEFSTDEKSGENIMKATAKLNGGGPVISVKTRGGDITLQEK